MTINEIVAILDDENFYLDSEIAIQPPDNVDISDGDSGGEEEGDIDRLSGNQLLAHGEAHVTQILNGEIVKSTIGDSSVEEAEEEVPSFVTKPNRIERKWIQQDLPIKREPEWTLPQFLEIDRQPNEWFELFFDSEVIEHIRLSCEMYASQKGNMSFRLNEHELRGFLALLLLSGYNTPARYRLWWDTSSDCHHPGVSVLMSRNRFEEILKYFHVCDNTNLNKEDKFSKVRPFWELLNKKWMKFFPEEKHISIDESMIPYFGRHSTKQHLHGKPIRFGYKVWSMCTRLGYLIQAEPYQGAKTGNTMPQLGVGGSVVMNLVNKLPSGEHYSFYIDNFFTSIPLLNELQTLGHDCTGTVRQNRVDGAPLTEVKKMKKLHRGSFDQLTDESTGVTVVRYMDNNVVTVASTVYGVNPLGKASRWSRKELKKIQIDQPLSVTKYNMYMGGVDRLDQNVSKYRVATRMKKWYWQLAMFPLNATVNNAYMLYRLSSEGKSKNALDFLGFTRKIVQVYMARGIVPRPRAGRPSQSSKKRVLDAVRLDNVGHLIVSNKTQVRCGECHKNTLKKCLKCNVGCHANCFIKFHSK